MLRKSARAVISGGPLAPEIKGEMYLREKNDGTEIAVNIQGLPQYRRVRGNAKPIGPFGFHIHEKGDCTVGNPNEPFMAVGGHYNPDNQPHGNHAGDLPVLFSNHGLASMTVYTDKFKVEDVIGRAVVIHMNPDDFVSQPAGNSGKRLACGIIEADDDDNSTVMY